MFLLLIRTETVKEGDEPVQTLGWLYVFDEGNNLVETFATLELPWKDNKNGVSCIPPAPRQLKKYNMELLQESPSFNYPHYWIKDVKNRTYIKIHRGNYYTQIEGCILIGREHKDLPTDDDTIKDVVGSKESLNKLIDLVGEKGEIQIKNLA